MEQKYLADCVEKKRKVALDAYKIFSEEESVKSGTLTVKVKGQSAVHESSGLQETCHILEDGKSIYNTTLNMSDLSTGINRYHHYHSHSHHQCCHHFHHFSLSCCQRHHIRQLS